MISHSQLHKDERDDQTEDEIVRELDAAYRELQSLKKLAKRRRKVNVSLMNHDENEEGVAKEQSADPHSQQEFKGRLLIVANRLPTTTKIDGDKITTERSSGGLVSALQSIQNMKMVWIGWPGSDVPITKQATLTKQLKDLSCVPVFLSDGLIEGYYNGYANNVLWPLFHYIPLPVEGLADIHRQFLAYTEANKMFAEVVLREYQDGDIVWVHDYHLMLLPGMLRRQEKAKMITCAFFLHTPFPSSDMYRVLPGREEILSGVLACDLIGLQTHAYMRHFASSCTRILGSESQADGILYNNWYTTLGAFPIGIDNTVFEKAVKFNSIVLNHVKDLRAKFDGRKILMGLDRLDYIKGIPNKLFAYEEFLTRYPEWIGKVVFIQICVPSRTDVKEYQILTRQTHELIGRINGKFGSPSRMPIHYIHRSIPFEQMCALYYVADAMIISSVRDGMNLVAFEYTACQNENHGVLILSEMAGAAQSLGAGTVQVNPWDVHELAGAIKISLEMSPGQRRELHLFSIEYVRKHTAQYWANSFLANLIFAASLQAEKKLLRSIVLDPLHDRLDKFGPFVDASNRRLVQLDADAVVEAFRNSKHRLIITGLTGFDGNGNEEKAENDHLPGVHDFRTHSRKMESLNENLHSYVKILARDIATTFLVLTSRTRHQCDTVMGDTDAWLGAENGFFLRKGGEKDPDKSIWNTLHENADLSWKQEVVRVLEYYTERTPRSYIKKSETHVSWHYRFCDPEFAKRQVNNILLHLRGGLLSNTSTLVLNEAVSHMIEIRPVAVSKGSGVERIMEEFVKMDKEGSPDYQYHNRKTQPLDFVLCIGTFLQRDNDLFSFLIAQGYKKSREGTCSCGRAITSAESSEQSHSIDEKLKHEMVIEKREIERAKQKVQSKTFNNHTQSRLYQESQHMYFDKEHNQLLYSDAADEYLAPRMGSQYLAPRMVYDPASDSFITSHSTPLERKKSFSLKQEESTPERVVLPPEEKEENGNIERVIPSILLPAAMAQAALANYASSSSPSVLEKPDNSFYYGTNIPYQRPGKNNQKHAHARRYRGADQLHMVQQRVLASHGLQYTNSYNSSDPSTPTDQFAESPVPIATGAQLPAFFSGGCTPPPKDAANVTSTTAGDFIGDNATKSTLPSVVKPSNQYVTCLKCLPTKHHIFTCTTKKKAELEGAGSAAVNYYDQLADIKSLMKRLAAVVLEERAERERTLASSQASLKKSHMSESEQKMMQSTKSLGKLQESKSTDDVNAQQGVQPPAESTTKKILNAKLFRSTDANSIARLAAELDAIEREEMS